MESPVEALANKEPWRTNQGQPLSILDRIWDGRALPHCTGSAEFEILEGGATGWWWCDKCGHCSNSKVMVHREVMNPLTSFLTGVTSLFRSRIAQGETAALVTYQALFVAGVALRYMATLPATHLKKYVHEHVELHD